MNDDQKASYKSTAETEFSAVSGLATTVHISCGGDSVYTMLGLERRFEPTFAALIMSFLLPAGTEGAAALAAAAAIKTAVAANGFVVTTPAAEALGLTVRKSVISQDGIAAVSITHAPTAAPSPAPPTCLHGKRKMMGSCRAAEHDASGGSNTGVVNRVGV